ncbi:hypothetical protein [Shewanella sp. YIC-542]|uniref:hypothetical protein n=1 Tax=Shewanella mytili TaxID=3377111 RepID=UPI00398EEC30
MSFLSMSFLRSHLSPRPLAGWLVLATWGLYLLVWVVDWSLYLPALASWLAIGFCWHKLSRSAKKQSAILFSAGIGMLLWGVLHGVSLDVYSATTRNLPLLAMFVAVCFLALTNPEQEDASQPTGNKGFWSTILSCHLLGAVINLSIIFVVGDRLQRKKPLSDEQILVLMRGFCAGAYWSPFFVAFGVAMTYAPGAQWSSTFIPGAMMAGLMFMLTYLKTRLGNLPEFRGYPLQRDSLVIPALLALAVLLLHSLYPQVNILILIAMVAPVSALLFLRGRPRRKVMVEYVEQRLPNVASQFSLFLAAGVFSTGVAAIIACYPQLFSFEASQLTPWLFWGISALMILAGLIGLHPVVSVSLVAPLLMPLVSNMNQLAFLYLSVWGTTTAVSPLSGVGLSMVSRYNASSRMILQQNWRYMLLMWFAAGGINVLLFA